MWRTTLVASSFFWLSLVLLVSGEPMTEFKLEARPEGITSGPGSTLYVSQILSGSVLAIDADTGEQTTAVPPQPDGRQAWGLAYHDDMILVAGGGPNFGGGIPEVYVYDATTGDPIVTCEPISLNETDHGAFLNDIAVLGDVAYITDSFANTIMALNLTLVKQQGNCTVWELYLPDPFIPQNPSDWGANGIVAYEFDNGVSGLLVAHEILGSVYSVQRIEDDGTPPHYQEIIGEPSSDIPPALGADGLLMVDGTLLYVTQNTENQIGVYNLSAQATDGVLSTTPLGVLTSPLFDTPAVSAAYDGYIFSTNSRFVALPEISEEADDNVVGVKNLYCCGNTAVDETITDAPAPAATTEAPNDGGGGGTDATAAPSGADTTSGAIGSMQQLQVMSLLGSFFGLLLALLF
ncbi:Superoxide dismutase [Seminavis robusta]|uniref:Superoxide dismutase n=1 Tax=Seminavis robusta TaxID=568900 RepID=A0A9N8EJB7_9STRA|nr:Superoxide dismutase [Seminavis robusta]|eukprot:Sro1078_g238750.1 Superoxide dismutase (406) ;mRNA; r:15625-16978